MRTDTKRPLISRNSHLADSRLHPLLSTALAGLILGEPVKPRQLVALLMAALGTALLVPRSEDSTLAGAYHCF